MKNISPEYRPTMYRGFIVLLLMPAHAALVLLWLCYATWGSGLGSEMGSKLWFPALFLWFGWPVFILKKRRHAPEIAALVVGIVLLMPAIIFAPMYIGHFLR